MMHVLGLDLGLTARNPLGLAIVDTDRMHICYAATYVGKAGDWQHRVRAVARHLRGLLATVKPVDLVVYEAPPLMRDAQALYKLSALAGVVLATAELYDLPCIGVAPAQAKVALTKDSQATKDDMMRAVQHIFGAKVPKDCADSIGVALAGEAVWRRQQLAEAAA